MSTTTTDTRRINPADFLILLLGVAGFALTFLNFYTATNGSGSFHVENSAWHGFCGWLAGVLLLVSAIATALRIAGVSVPARDTIADFTAKAGLAFAALALIIHPGITFSDGGGTHHRSALFILVPDPNTSTAPGHIGWTWAAWALLGVAAVMALLLSFTSPEPAVRRRRRLIVLTGQLLLVAVIFGSWELATSGAHPWLDSYTFGRPSIIFQGDQQHGGLRWFFNAGTEFGTYGRQIYVTLKEAVIGFFVGSAAGIIVGIALGQNPYLAEVFSPFIKVVNAIPRIVLGSIFVVAFGLGLLPKILLAGVLVFFVVFFNAFQGVREVDQNILANARVLGASKWDITRHVTVPSAMTWIIASLHSAFGFAIVGVIVAEVLGSTEGLGDVIHASQGLFDGTGVFAVMITVAVVVLLAETLLTRLEHRLLSWRPPSRSDSGSI